MNVLRIYNKIHLIKSFLSHNVYFLVRRCNNRGVVDGTIMRVLFGAVVCILIDCKILITSAQSSITPSNFTSTTSDNFTSTFSSAYSTSSTTSVSDDCTVLEPPVNVGVSAEKTTAVLNWTTHQTNSNCFPNVIVVDCEAIEEENVEGWQWIIKNSNASNTIENVNYTISVSLLGLTEFTNYTCNATLTDGIKFSEQQIIKFRTKEEVSDPPYNLTIAEIWSKGFTLRWEKPVKNPGVFINYLVHVVSNGPNHSIPPSCEPHVYDQWIETTNQTYSFYEAYADYNYDITVFLQNSAGNGGQENISVTTSTSASQAPTEVHQTLLLNSEENIVIQNISWNRPCDTNGEIYNFMIGIEGQYTANDSIHDNRTITVTASDNETYFKENVLMPAFLYNMTIQAIGINEGALFSHSFETEDNFPGPPIIEGVSENGANSFTLFWSEPERKAGNITSYMVLIDSLRPLYDTDLDRCPTLQWHFNDSVLSNVLSYTFKDLPRPYYEYRVSVAAATSKGYGNYSSDVANTTSSAPERLEDVKFELLDGNVTSQVSWRTPCNINGPIKEFNIEIQGNYTEDDSLSISSNWSLPYYYGRYDYNHSISLNESYNFEMKIWITLEDGTDGIQDSKNLTTPDGYPGPPDITNITNNSNQSFTISWDRPSKRNGRITEYQVNTTTLGPLYETSCNITDSSYDNIISGNVTYFTFSEGHPYYNYSISVKAKTARGWGDVSNVMTAATDQSVPENVENIKITISSPTNEDYNAYVNISFHPPCRTNGPFSKYELIYHGTRDNFETIEDTISSQNNAFTYIQLRPEYIYDITIKTKTVNYSSPGSTKSFTAPAGIPQFSSSEIDLQLNTGTYGATINLNKESFNVTNGAITYLALILSETNETGGDFSTWESSVWPNTNRNGYCQLTEDWWNPFNDVDSIQFVIGNQTNNNCNQPLESGKDYYLIVRLFTQHFYKNSPTYHFRTEDISKLGLILGVIFGLLIFALLGFAAFFVWRKNLINEHPVYCRLPPVLLAKKTPVKIDRSDGNTSIPINKFVQYCKHLENNPEKFAEQYMLLTEKSKEIMSTHTTTFAELTENRRKNRYTNILPYDATRVKLLIDEDDEIGSDYINASYIKGYSGNTEYIATQGPLPTTCRDFWKMVIQENVSIIVMVTQFVEDNKEKCYKYFPSNHETMTIGDDMEVKCTMELHFGTYCVRSIQVKRDSTQITVTHMQYLDWPDFNVPKGTGTMLQFCHQLRERLKIEGGYVIVHCSAGVGRTGTLIATDILVQNINAGKNIDIFNTVLELRRQRMIMVQAQKQYVYIHNLIRDTLESQTSELNENLEPLYDNQSALQMKTDDDNLINKEKESQF